MWFLLCVIKGVVKQVNAVLRRGIVLTHNESDIKLELSQLF